MNKEDKKKLLQKALEYHHNGKLNLADEDIYKKYYQLMNAILMQTIYMEQYLKKKIF